MGNLPRGPLFHTNNTLVKLYIKHADLTILNLVYHLLGLPHG